MTAADLLTDLDAAGVICVLDAAGELVIRAPRGTLTPERRAAIRHHRAALALLLKGDDRVADPAPKDPENVSFGAGSPTPSSDGTTDGRRRFYTDGSRLESDLWAAGFRLCDRCGALTVHRVTCLRCDPAQSLALAVAPAAPASCSRCGQGSCLAPFDVCQSCKADDAVRERVAARRVPQEGVA
jgi:hypothetical protein